MQKHIFKIITLILIISLFSLNLKTFATNEPENNSTQNTTNNESNNTSNETNEETHPEDVHSTSSNTTETNTSRNSSNTQTREPSIRTLNTIPEANLGLNNILNVILIAIGIVIILLNLYI